MEKSLILKIQFNFDKRMNRVRKKKREWRKSPYSVC